MVRTSEEWACAHAARGQNVVRGGFGVGVGDQGRGTHQTSKNRDTGPRGECRTIDRACPGSSEVWGEQ